MLLRGGIITFGVVVGFLLAVIVFVIARRITSATSPAGTLDPVSVVHQIQRLNELVSVKYTVQKVVGLEEQKVPFGSEKLLLFVQAEVLAGIDLSKLAAADIKWLPAKRMQVMLPPPKIEHVVIDDKETTARSHGGRHGCPTTLTWSVRPG